MIRFVPKQTADSRGFTMIELMMVGLIVSLIAGGLFSVYFNIVNTYYTAQQDVLLQAEGERILDLIANGGYYGGEKIFGLNSADSDLPNNQIGFEDSAAFSEFNDDYKIGFYVDQSGSNPRKAIFYVDFNDSQSLPTSKLYFKLISDATGETYTDNGGKGILLTDNMLMRNSGSDESVYGVYDKTWFKVQKLPSDGAYCAGIRISFYLADLDLSYDPNTGNYAPVEYNYRLDRRLADTDITADQAKSFLAKIPYPIYFSRTIYFPNRIN